MLRLLLLVCLISLSSEVNANNKSQIINKLKDTLNLNFDFEQNINGKLSLETVQFNIQKKCFVRMIKKINL